MAASFPNQLKVTFGARRQDLVDVVEADDVNALDDEVVAVEATLGRNPHVSTLFPGATSVADRLGFTDDLLNTIKGWFNGAGTVTESQVTGLTTDLTNLNTTLATKAATSYVDSHDASTLASAHAYTDTETAARQAAVTGVQNNLNTEITNRTNAVTGVQNNLNTEVTNRINADNNLQTNINGKAAAFHTHVPGDSGIVGGQAFFNGVANGQFAIPHGLGYRPRLAVVTHFTGGQPDTTGPNWPGAPVFVTVMEIDTVNINVKAWRVYTSGGATQFGPFVSDINFFWIAF